jgi:hypothetical protein
MSKNGRRHLPPTLQTIFILSLLSSRHGADIKKDILPDAGEEEGESGAPGLPLAVCHGGSPHDLVLSSSEIIYND